LHGFQVRILFHCIGAGIGDRALHDHHVTGQVDADSKGGCAAYDANVTAEVTFLDGSALVRVEARMMERNTRE
jgi:hypothetical protein